MNTTRRVPRNLSLVRFDFAAVPADFHDKYPFTEGAAYIFFGEIPNLPEHCVVADHKTGQILSGYHTENFVELAPGEV